MVNTLIARGCIPKAILFEGRMHDTLAMRVVRLAERIFLWIEHQIFFRCHIDAHQCYRRHGSVRALLKQYDISSFYTANHNAEDAAGFLKKMKPSYLLLCGTRIIGSHILAIPSKGTLNAHSAMLPKYRGAKSEYWILSNGDNDAAGVTIHWVEAELDSGAICLQEHIRVAAHETTKTLRAKSMYLSAHLFAETLRRLQNGETLWTAQGQGKLQQKPSPDAVRAFDAKILRRRK